MWEKSRFSLDLNTRSWRREFSTAKIRLVYGHVSQQASPCTLGVTGVITARLVYVSGSVDCDRLLSVAFAVMLCLGGVLASYSCYNRSPQTGWLKNTE